MRRPFVLPISAAVVGALLAIGVAALDRADDGPYARVHVVRTIDQADLDAVELEFAAVEAEIAEAMEELGRVEIESEFRTQEALIREIREKVRVELKSALEAQELTEAERARVREAMEQLEEQLPAMTGVAELVDGLTREDGSAHRRPSGN